MENAYSIKEVIEEKFDEIKEHLVEIKVQTTKTNGRVTSLESTRTQMWTAIALLLFFGGTIITLSIIAIDSKIKSGLEQALLSKVSSVTYEEI